MNKEWWFLALPAYFLMGPEGLIGNIVLFGSLAVISIRRDTGWRWYVLYALCPTIIQSIMLSILGALGNASSNHPASYLVMIVAELLSVCMIFLSFRRSSRRFVKILTVCSQIYGMALACFIGLMGVTGDWL